MPRAHGHQPFAHIAAGRNAHPQAIARVLVHIGPIGPRQTPPRGLGHQHRVARAFGSGKNHLTPIRRKVACKAR